MWLVIVYILVNGQPQMFNYIEALDEAECREVAALSNRLFPSRVTVCQYVEDEGTPT
jgi:hypothetical protein